MAGQIEIFTTDCRWCFLLFKKEISQIIFNTFVLFEDISEERFSYLTTHCVSKFLSKSVFILALKTALCTQPYFHCVLSVIPTFLAFVWRCSRLTLFCSFPNVIAHAAWVSGAQVTSAQEPLISRATATLCFLGSFSTTSTNCPPRFALAASFSGHVLHPNLVIFNRSAGMCKGLNSKQCALVTTYYARA